MSVHAVCKDGLRAVDCGASHYSVERSGASGRITDSAILQPRAVGFRLHTLLLTLLQPALRTCR